MLWRAWSSPTNWIGISKMESTRFNGDVNRLSTITRDDVVDAIEAGRVRYRIFGEQGVWGQHTPFNGDFERAADAFLKAEARGLFRLYQDSDGLFVGPASPSLVERNPLCEGGALQ